MKRTPFKMLILVVLMLMLPGAAFCRNNVSPASDAVELQAGASQTFKVAKKGRADHREWSLNHKRVAIDSIHASTAKEVSEKEAHTSAARESFLRITREIVQRVIQMISFGGAEKTYYLDWDQDGYGNSISRSKIKWYGYVEQSGDCNDSNAAIHPGATEVQCDGMDQNCDGADSCGTAQQAYYQDADGDGYGNQAMSVMGAQPGYVLNSSDCNDGNASIHPNAVETCNGLDDDCNSQIDDGIAPVATTCGVGACAGNTGVLSCVGGAMIDSCNPSVGAQAEICDGVDNDCNGLSDDGQVCGCNNGETRAASCGVGACASTGMETCVNGQWSASPCVPGTPTAEICNDVDDNCNGQTDDGISCVCTNGETRAVQCGMGACASTGTETCISGQWSESTCVPGAPSAEICNGIDDNCNGLIDGEEVTCGDEIPESPLNVAASDIASGLTDVVVTWSASTGAAYYNVYRAVWEENSEYELVGSNIAGTSHTFIQDWQIDVLDVIGEFPATDPGYPETVIAAMEIYRVTAVPVMLNFKAPAFFRVEACNAAGECSAPSPADAGQAEFIHRADYSEVAQLTSPLWLYPVISTMGTVPGGERALNWCGADVCGSGGGMTLSRLNQSGLRIQFDFYFENYIEGWASHPAAEFMINGYIGGDGNLLAMTGIEGAGTSNISYGAIEAQMFTYIFMSLQLDLSEGYVSLTYNGNTYQYTLPITVIAGNPPVDFGPRPLAAPLDDADYMVDRRNTPYPVPFFEDPLTLDECALWTEDLIQDCTRIPDPRPVP